MIKYLGKIVCDIVHDRLPEAKIFKREDLSTAKTIIQEIGAPVSATIRMPITIFLNSYESIKTTGLNRYLFIGLSFLKSGLSMFFCTILYFVAAWVIKPIYHFSHKNTTPPQPPQDVQPVLAPISPQHQVQQQGLLTLSVLEIINQYDSLTQNKREGTILNHFFEKLKKMIDEKGIFYAIDESNEAFYKETIPQFIEDKISKLPETEIADYIKEHLLIYASLEIWKKICILISKITNQALIRGILYKIFSYQYSGAEFNADIFKIYKYQFTDEMERKRLRKDIGTSDAHVMKSNLQSIIAMSRESDQ